jgi:hypothetical protein
MSQTCAALTGSRANGVPRFLVVGRPIEEAGTLAANEAGITDRAPDLAGSLVLETGDMLRVRNDGGVPVRSRFTLIRSTGKSPETIQHTESSRRGAVRVRSGGAIAAAVLAACLGAAPANAPSYETPPALKASDFFEPAFLKGPNYQIEDDVTSDGVFNTYTITSPFGTFRVEGTSVAAERVHEIGAIAQLKEVDKIAVAAGAVASSVVDVGKGVLHVVTNPVKTVAGIGDGVARLFGRIGRGAKRTAEKMGNDEVRPESENLVDRKNVEKASPKSTGGKTLEATGELAKDIIGVNFAMRSWAKKLDVDPYTRNEVLHKELRDVAQYDAGGNFSTKLVPGGAVVLALGATATADDLILMKEPDELVTLNEKRLKAMGVKPENSRAFRLNDQYNLTRQVRLVTALDALDGVSGRPEFVARAAGAQVDADAQFYMESALMAEMFNRKQARLNRIVGNLPGACVLAEGDRFVCLYPLDYVVWTEGVAGHIHRISKRVEADFPKAKRELWLTGRVSPRTARELAALGWTVREKSLSVLSDPPTTPDKVQAAK